MQNFGTHWHILGQKNSSGRRQEPLLHCGSSLNWTPTMFLWRTHSCHMAASLHGNHVVDTGLPTLDWEIPRYIGMEHEVGEVWGGKEPQ